MKNNPPAYINSCLLNYFNAVKNLELRINFDSDYQGFAQMSNRKVSFMTRFRPKTVYEVKSTHEVLSSKGILADEYIEWSSDYAKKRSAPKRLRRIAFYDAEKKRTFEFLSNHFHLAASTIAAIYKDPWKVELFAGSITKYLPFFLSSHS